MGLEPTSLAALAPKASAFANFATCPLKQKDISSLTIRINKIDFKINSPAFFIPHSFNEKSEGKSEGKGEGLSL